MNKNAVSTSTLLCAEEAEALTAAARETLGDPIRKADLR